MASIRSKSSMVVAVVVMIVVPCFFTPATALGRKVGGKMKLKGVETNQEVQQLGRFCVKEYNRMYAPTNGQVIVFCHVSIYDCESMYLNEKYNEMFVCFD